MSATTNRVHFGAGEPISRAGGMHNYILSLSLGQRQIGLSTHVVDEIRNRHSFRMLSNAIDTRGEVRSRTESLSIIQDARAHFHFAQSTMRLLGGPLRRRDLADDIFHFHGPWADEGRVQGNSAFRVYAKRFVEKATYPRFCNYVTASIAFKEVLVNDFGIDDKRVKVVYPGVDLSRFNPSNKEEARERLGLRNDEFVIACVRRLEPRMGIIHAIRALRELPNARLVIAGTGSLRSTLEQAAGDAGVLQRVTFLGRVSDSDLPFVYRAADVTVVPTVALEGFGLIVREAIAAGSPVVATAVGGLPEAMGVFADDWIVPPTDEHALAERLRVIALGNGPTSDQLDAASRTFGLDVMAQQLEFN